MCCKPTKTGVEQVKRLIRYLAGAKRLVWKFGFQKPKECAELTVNVDTNFVGCHIARRSTSGGAACRGDHLITHWSSTQSIVAPSSAEAVLTGIAKGEAQGLVLHTIAKDLGMDLGLCIQSDATAAIGISRRPGLARLDTLPQLTSGSKIEVGKMTSDSKRS